MVTQYHNLTNEELAALAYMVLTPEDELALELLLRFERLIPQHDEDPLPWHEMNAGGGNG